MLIGGDLLDPSSHKRSKIASKRQESVLTALSKEGFEGINITVYITVSAYTTVVSMWFRSIISRKIVSLLDQPYTAQ